MDHCSEMFDRKIAGPAPDRQSAPTDPSRRAGAHLCLDVVLPRDVEEPAA
jgi:hypothetical protein